MNADRSVRRIFRKTVWQMTPAGQILLPEECESFLYRGAVAELAAFLGRPGQGFAGRLSRPDAPNDVVTKIYGATPFSAYGLPVKLSAGTIIPIANTGDAVYGILVQPFPIQSGSVSDSAALGSATPPTAGPASVLRKGYITVQNRNGVPAEGGNVYIRFQNPAGIKIVGGIEASATGDTYQLTGASFMSAADANGAVEISFN